MKTNKQEIQNKIDTLTKELEDLKNLLNKTTEDDFKRFFLDIINGCTVSWKTDRFLSYRKNNQIYMLYDKKHNIFHLSYYHIWSKLESNFGSNNQEIKELTRGILEEHFKCKVDSTVERTDTGSDRLEEHFKCKVDSTIVVIAKAIQRIRRTFQM